MTVELAAGADLSKVMCGVGGSAVEIGRIMVAGVEVWPGLVHIEDDFNRLNGDVGANYDYTPGAGFGSQRPVIFGNAMRAGVPTSSAPGNVCFGSSGTSSGCGARTAGSKACCPVTPRYSTQCWC